MPQYLSPGVYVEEVPSGIQPIAGVGTSTAAFLGVMPELLPINAQVTDEAIGTGTGTKKNFSLSQGPVVIDAETFTIRVDGTEVTEVTLSNDGEKGKITFTEAPANDAAITGDYLMQQSPAPPAGEPFLCTNFSEFRNAFGDFCLDTGQNRLAHAVYGFFNNGGSRCYVTRVEPSADGVSFPTNEVIAALEGFEAIDEIALVAAPGATEPAVVEELIGHCERTGDRFAILDSPETVETITHQGLQPPRNSDYAAYYFPWVEVYDPASDNTVLRPPSGHLAGIYARTDTERGVHKAPANVPVRGALGLAYPIGRAKQDGLNPAGINVLRDFGGTLRVWGARTLGGDANGEFKYVNVRRLFLFLRESIEQGTQWVVFEPNDPSLWAKVRRNVIAFLTNVWRSGALFGNTPEEAFYIKCDAETNPPEVRNAGQLITEIGVAVVQPAEFVVFRISQWSGQDR